MRIIHLSSTISFLKPEYSNVKDLTKQKQKQKQELALF